MNTIINSQMSTMRIRLFALFLMAGMAMPLAAQDAEPAAADENRRVKPILGADLVNQYLWRGQDLGNLSLQPTLGIEWQGLSFSAWGSVGLTNVKESKEVDLTLAYNIKGFNVGVTDYWFGEGSYFQYRAGRTTHVWEANVGYNFGFLSVQWYTNFAGDDGMNPSGNRAYSSYIELTAPFRLATLDWEATVGAVPYATTFYDANGFCVTNVSLRATKDFVIKERFHLPVFAALVGNPRSEKMYFLFGVSFSL